MSEKKSFLESSTENILKTASFSISFLPNILTVFYFKSVTGLPAGVYTLLPKTLASVLTELNLCPWYLYLSASQNYFMSSMKCFPLKAITKYSRACFSLLTFSKTICFIVLSIYLLDWNSMLSLNCCYRTYLRQLSQGEWGVLVKKQSVWSQHIQSSSLIYQYQPIINQQYTFPNPKQPPQKPTPKNPTHPPPTHPLHRCRSQKSPILKKQAYQISYILIRKQQGCNKIDILLHYQPTYTQSNTLYYAYLIPIRHVLWLVTGWCWAVLGEFGDAVL